MIPVCDYSHYASAPVLMIILTMLHPPLLIILTMLMIILTMLQLLCLWLFSLCFISCAYDYSHYAYDYSHYASAPVLMVILTMLHPPVFMIILTMFQLPVLCIDLCYCCFLHRALSWAFAAPRVSAPPHLVVEWRHCAFMVRPLSSWAALQYLRKWLKLKTWRAWTSMTSLQGPFTTFGTCT